MNTYSAPVNVHVGLKVSRAAEAVRRVCECSYAATGEAAAPNGCRYRGVRLERRCLQLDLTHFERVALAIRALERSLRAPDWDAKLVRPVEPAPPPAARTKECAPDGTKEMKSQQQHALFAMALSADTNQVLLADAGGMQLRLLQMPDDWASIDPLVPTRHMFA